MAQSGDMSHGDPRRAQVRHGQVRHGQVRHGQVRHGQVRHGQVPNGGVEPEPLLAGSRSAGPLVWWPLLSVIYLLVVPNWQPIGVALLGCALVVAGLLSAAWRLGPFAPRDDLT
jgi:hypothetical protein